MERACFPNVSQFPIGETLSQDANYAYSTRQGILTKVRAYEHLQKFCEHEQASTHLIFRAIRANGKILSTFKLDGAIQ